MRIELDDTGQRIRRLEAPDPNRKKLFATFDYSPDGNLISATNTWSNTYSYEYDQLHNLILSTYPDGTSEKLTYDTDYDRVQSFQSRNGCIENYRHTFTAEPSKDKASDGTTKQPTTRTQTSIAQLTCPKKVPSEVRFDFQYTKRADNRWALAQLRLTRAGKTQTVQYKLGGLQ